MFAPATVLIRKIENDINGSSVRVSQPTNPARRAAAAAKMPIVAAEPQP